MFFCRLINKKIPVSTGFHSSNKDLFFVCSVSDVTHTSAVTGTPVKVFDFSTPSG